MNHKLVWYKTVFRMLKRGLLFDRSSAYWEMRYMQGGHSGEGSYGRLAEFKAEFLNEFVHNRRVQSVLEFGCGDGNQLSLAVYPEYVGVDVSTQAIQACRELFARDTSKSFVTAENLTGQIADLVLSLDVIYHLVEDMVFESYMRQLFDAARKYVIVYSSNSSAMFAESPHVRNREFTAWVAANEPAWKLESVTPNRYPVGICNRETSFAHFFVYEHSI